MSYDDTTNWMRFCVACAHSVDDHRLERWPRPNVLADCHHRGCTCEMYTPHGVPVEFEPKPAP